MDPAARERSDEQLLAAARAEPEAIAPFYRRHVRALSAYFWRRSRDADTTAVVALAAALRSGSSPGTAGDAAPVPSATSTAPAALVPPTLSTALRGTVVAVLDATTTAGAAREVADLLQRHGATLDRVGTAAEQTLPASVIEFRPGMERRAEAVARLGVRDLRERDAGTALRAPRADIVVSIGADRREP